MKTMPTAPFIGFITRAFMIAAFIAAFAALAPAPAQAQDASEIVVRLNRLEGLVRQLSGSVEELQFENRQLRDQLQRFQEDVDFRFEEAGGGSAPPRERPEQRSQTTPATPQAAPAAPLQISPGLSRGDAFDPARDPMAPGAPQPLGSTTPSSPRSDSGLGSTATIGSVIEEEARTPAEGGPLNLALPRYDVPPGLERAGPSIAATGDADPRVVYDTAYAYLLQAQYERAEMGFRQFLQSHPRNDLVPDATYWLGETYAQRGRHREAAEQFLKVSTEHPSSRKAPDSLLKLGGALAELGAREQACATLAEIPRQYPQAAVGLRENVEREQRRAGCA
ncbi:MAG TPA: tol-pal system protein YbgF [Saliniramus sp.]|nr:tol-pal system protein YbgF [Saliniramus sp.]